MIMCPTLLPLVAGENSRNLGARAHLIDHLCIQNCIRNQKYNAVLLCKEYRLRGIMVQESVENEGLA